jgi:hypothetical protein
MIANPLVCWVRNTSLFSGAVGVGMLVLMAVFVFPMSVFTWAMRVPMSSKDTEAGQVRGQPQAADNQDELRVPNLGRFDKSRKGFEDDGHAKGDEEDGVEECP